MSPLTSLFRTDPTWYERYWLQEAPPSERRAALKRLLANAQRMAAMLLSTAWAVASIGAVH